MSSDRRVIVVTATLDFARGWTALDIAAQSGGVDTYGFVSVDEMRRGGTRTANRGLRMAFETRIPYIVYLNDDVKITQKNWLQRMLRVMDEDPGIGVAGISGKCRTVPQSRCHKGMRCNVRTVSHLSYFCVMIRRTVLAKIGYLNERFIHYGCDNDYSIRVRLSGWRVVLVEDVWGEHDLGPIIEHWKNHDSPLYKRIWPTEVPLDGKLESRLRLDSKAKLYQP